jgi:hypothetical protein
LPIFSALSPLDNVEKQAQKIAARSKKLENKKAKKIRFSEYEKRRP